MNAYQTDAMKIMDEFANLAASLGGLRVQLMDQGFGEQQAGDLVVLLFRQSIADSTKGGEQA